MRVSASLTALAGVSLVLTGLVGCGGGSSPGSAARPALSRQLVLQILGGAMDNSESLRENRPNANRSASTRAAKPKRVIPARNGHTRAHFEDDPGNFWFDEAAAVWVMNKPGLSDEPESGSGFLFFEDQAHTIPAGSDLTFVSDPSVSPRTLRQEVSYTAGALKGFWQKDLITFRDDDSGSRQMTSFDPAAGSYTLTGAWNAAGSGTWDQRFEALDRLWQTYKWVHNANSTYTMVITTSQGITVNMLWQQDMSGTGTITGSGDGLPATLKWNENGDGTVTWSDGAISSFNAWDF
jgi:hypothetical protein